MSQLRNLILMKELADDKVVQTILQHGPITQEEFARMAYPVRAAYLALMLSWAKQRGLDHLIEQRDALKPMVLRTGRRSRDDSALLGARGSGKPRGDS